MTPTPLRTLASTTASSRPSPLRRLGAVLTLGLTALSLAACGTTDVEASTDATKDASAVSESCADDSTSTATGPVELTDDFGRTVKLDEPAKRVAVLEWQQTEDLLSLCVTPVGVADVEGFTTWDTAEKLPDGVTDVGQRGEPDLDTLYGTDPDLIIVEASSKDDEIIGQLEERGVPVLATQGADAKDPIGNMKDLFSLIGKATGRTERADAVLEEFDQHLAEAKKKVEDVDLPTRDFVYFDGWVDGGNVSIRPFGKGALFSALGEELGLKPAWTGKTDAIYGLGQTDIEGLTSVGDANLFFTSTDDPAGNYVTELEKNDIWTSLPAVEDGRAHAFPSSIWTFGGPRTSEQAVDAYVDALTK
ncbi:iron-siderophore ABC transporter substrate-binding protein [Brachybacterium halotolerans subsp. kimchii]|uniref:iron-siderophore ABC transporter substrate-binding protein n=1 Tax=Brachybacterium halotolerans TaxID=2795215 RepID=UPI001E44A315|nr:iron-siderophore ABC transporter substrate-binding protein [Brachybacterium halotolerans]UEJ82005.1 iron-siderophore ABC transporter substrate-binding protein [Brachybacterium halotolerans subsp. kimchii]